MLNFVKGLLLIALFCGFGSISPLQDSSHNADIITPTSGKTRIKTIVLDAGHGGKDPGCHGANHNESKIALKIVLEVGAKIKEEYPEMRVLYTRMKDVFVNLHERSAIANRNKADLFISIHCNSHPSSKFAGTETYTMGLHKTNENLDVAKRENSVILQKVERQFKKQTNRTSFGVKQAGFLVLWETAMPSVLIEAGFLTNEKEEKYLASSEGQDEVAQAVFKAFKLYKEEIEN
ncbi:MAG: N-acetylmuramoyl-L-alanine amidase [Arcicella sp.]|nr:N-acetylmuramoyl-L-alanine amidase [Arcicella sp.]